MNCFQRTSCRLGLTAPPSLWTPSTLKPIHVSYPGIVPDNPMSHPIENYAWVVFNVDDVEWVSPPHSPCRRQVHWNQFLHSLNGMLHQMIGHNSVKLHWTFHLLKRDNYFVLQICRNLDDRLHLLWFEQYFLLRCVSSWCFGALPLPHLGAFGLGTERWRVTPLLSHLSQWNWRSDPSGAWPPTHELWPLAKANQWARLKQWSPSLIAG